MASPFDLLPRVQPSDWPNEPYPGATSIIGRVFDAVDTTYKFYWFLSLLEHVSQAEEKDRLTVSILEIGREMIVQAWYTRRQFRLWFGHQDRLQLVVDHLGEASALEPAVSPYQVRSAARHLSDHEVRKVLGYVPYRFLTPWFRPVLRGLASDNDRNTAIRLFAERSRRAARPSPYWFDQVTPYASQILLDRSWLVFLRSNYLLLRSFSLISLARYFEIRNPGVPGIINKLERPNERSLAIAITAWRAVLRVQPFRCIYSGNDLTTRFHLDHFIPWSFVTHDLFWNLLPVSPSANIRKSDSLPNLDRYLSPYVTHHYQAARTLARLLSNATSTERKSFHAVLQQYADLFEAPEQALLSYSPEQFEERLLQAKDYPPLSSQRGRSKV
jgi:hypothetical protein